MKTNHSGKKDNTKSGKETPERNSNNKPVKRFTKPLKNTPKKDTPVKNPDEIRLNKYISNSGICSRREADLYIKSGNVRVNDQVVTELGKVVKLTDKVWFDGAILSPVKKQYLLLNKPKNFTTANNEEKLKDNVLQLISGASKSNLQPVGKMDKNTTGLLLFTNDTDLIRKFTEPKQRSTKIYQVSLDKNLKFEDLQKIQKGLTVEDYKIFVEEISYIENEPKSEIGITVKTSNPKVVRTIFEHLSYNVLRIDRVYFAGLTKKNLPRGTWRFLTEQEIINLKNV
jgi:23S rRNA pseudouridine2605 synthase